jgi:hypothetical protein
MLTSVLSLGQIVATSDIRSRMLSDLSFHTSIYTSLMRHEEGDWGEVCEEDHASNQAALVSSRRIFSVYECGPGHQKYGHKIYVITESDRSAITVLWPWEY